ncbi:hypothetical protein KIN20_035258 [Parelaphostrongylus tenuis]|uniref:Core Histone H2A/H2B/H3 domain-containing protein n=1 Tax=Parelaphostrongylus tenuis TaxID=148309 RepID=A0AAD5RBC0_PARTN|nr:hypothetical protein KIN20_035258 [Parelaphostrongylus tenuis]
MVRAKDVPKRTSVAGGRQGARREPTLEVIPEVSIGRNKDRDTRFIHISGSCGAEDVEAIPSQRRSFISSSALFSFDSYPVYRSRSKPCYPTEARAQQEIRRYQHSTKLLIPKRSMQHVVREVMTDQCPDQEYRFSADALDAIHEAAEAFLVVFSRTHPCALLSRGA